MFKLWLVLATLLESVNKVNFQSEFEKCSFIVFYWCLKVKDLSCVSEVNGQRPWFFSNILMLLLVMCCDKKWLSGFVVRSYSSMISSWLLNNKKQVVLLLWIIPETLSNLWQEKQLKTIFINFINFSKLQLFDLVSSTTRSDQFP